MSTTVNQIIEVMKQRHGLDISMYNVSFLAMSVEKRLAATFVGNQKAYFERLSEDRAEAETFFQSLSISFSEFFRNPLTFALLEQVILPSLVEEKVKSGEKEIRIWSAGCAAGQEAYSVAILLEELARVRAKVIPFRIFATDICERELVLARQGVYDVSSLQHVRLKHLRDFFTVQEGSHMVVPGLKERVDFSDYDLLDQEHTSPPACIFGDFDLIFCSNLLFYYRPDLQQMILKRMRQSLSSEGYLVTGEAERSIVKASGFYSVASPVAIFQTIRHKG